MIRKDELAERATQFLKDNGPYDEDGDIYLCDVEELLGALLQVEREALKKVESYYVTELHTDMEEYPDQFVKWLRSQQQELT